MVVSEYDASWPAAYGTLRAALEAGLTRATAIEHVGSTSVPGLKAKPVIDLDIVIPALEDFGPTRAELEALGYAWAGDQGIPGREAFKRGQGNCHPVLDSIPHHLYVCAEGSAELERHVLFRDYLRAHDEARDEYARIKDEILERHGEDDRAAYVRAKEEDYGWFFENVLELAGRTRRR